ncbi:GNAT family N-acetyltransferase [Streptomyces sp. NPDC002564]|uniref:GNAT family N-acetyltransferase n=1 Tax=Streptomyces sp. NPDC002564 TaxID=3364649 RepID=UPI00369D2403
MTPPARPPAVHFERVVETLPAGRRAVVMLDDGDRQVGRLEYQVCHLCRLGHIGTVAVAAHWQGQGLARHAVHTALAPCLGYAWATSRQSADGRRFFAAMTDETGIAFRPDGPRCPHMELCPDGARDRRRIRWHPALLRRKVIGAATPHAPGTRPRP